jgi:predicted nucleic acid-binding protein
LTSIVVDASIAASWLFKDERGERSATALTALENAVGLVPQLWHYEMRNLMLTAARRGRLSPMEAAMRVRGLADLPLETDGTPDLQATFDLSVKHDLTFYDGLYLELAYRRRAALATMDRRLLAAAQAEGVAWD